MEAFHDGAGQDPRFFDAHGFFAYAADADADEVIPLQDIERARDRSSHPVRVLTESLNPPRFTRSFFPFRPGVLRPLAHGAHFVLF